MVWWERKKKDFFKNQIENNSHPSMNSLHRAKSKTRLLCQLCVACLFEAFTWNQSDELCDFIFEILRSFNYTRYMCHFDFLHDAKQPTTKKKLKLKRLLATWHKKSRQIWLNSQCTKASGSLFIVKLVDHSKVSTIVCFSFKFSHIKSHVILQEVLAEQKE